MTTATSESPGSALQLPGLNTPINYVPEQTSYGLFPNALNVADMDGGSSKQTLLTLREIGMLEFMDSVIDKPDWHIKARLLVHNDVITNKWKKACETEGSDMTAKMADYCIAELRHKATTYSSIDPPPPIVVYPGDVVKSDTAVSEELKQALQRAVKAFEDAIPLRLKDWHPGSNDLVWDLVHPSLFPLVYGRTRVLADGNTTSLSDCIDRCGQGQVLPVQTQRAPALVSRYRFPGKVPNFADDRAYSTKFQWLPCEVDISGENAKITTYINNLHPKKEKTLYELIERLIDASIPLWSKTLAPLADQNHRQTTRIEYDGVVYDPDPEDFPETEGPQQGEDEDEDEFAERRDEWVKATRRLVYPEPANPFSPHPEPATLDLKERYGTTGLQVIVKLANIHLTRDKPRYEGGSWHVEGQMNERIVATSLYYYSSENITPSLLSFRQQGDPEALSMDVRYPQNDHDWLWDIFGCEQEGGATQELGSVETREGRLLTFPNILQHQVGPFELVDGTKPGHRKIVALFLVDPNMKVISTAHVPCQQQEWWWETVMAGENTFIKAKGNFAGPAVEQIPIELQDNILDDVDFPIKLEDAKALRLELMEERKAYVQAADRAFTHHALFNLCEH